MGFEIMAYAEGEQKGFQEFFLPETDNQDYALLLKKDRFHLPENIEVKLQIINHQWSMVKSKEYFAVFDSQESSCFGQPLLDETQISLYREDQAPFVFLFFVRTEEKGFLFEKYKIGALTEITIGADSRSTIHYDAFEYVSDHHARMYRDGDNWYLENLSQSGTFVNGIFVTEPVILQFGDSISVFGLKIVFLGGFLAIGSLVASFKTNAVLQRSSFVRNDIGGADVKTAKQYFRISPRTIPTLCSDGIQIEAPPAAHTSKKKPLFLMIGPSITMIIPMIMGVLVSLNFGQSGNSMMRLAGLLTAAVSAIIGVMWALINLLHTGKEEEQEETTRKRVYREYLQKAEEIVRDAYEYNTKLLRETYLPASACVRFNRESPELWARNWKHTDFLFVRFGIGNMPSPFEVKIPNKKLTLNPDPMLEQCARLQEKYQILQGVPLGIDLQARRLVGVVTGGNRDNGYQILYLMAAQIAANTSYTDVKMVFLYDRARDSEMLDFARWLPHVQREDRKGRYYAACKEDIGDVCYEITQILRQRAEEEQENVRPLPHFILFVAAPDLLEGEPIYKYILETKESYGLSAVLMADKIEELPNACSDLVQCDGEQGSSYNIADNDRKYQEFKVDQIWHKEMETFARELADIEIKGGSSGGEIPNSLDFMEMYGVSSLEELHAPERWAKNRTYESMRAMLGKKSGGAICYLDIHEKYHGPHGLVAGTTGSGKSETLQTYLLSLAVNFSPDDVGLFIIDFKGGGMANLFTNLPHLIGQISNLSGNQVRRAMISIKSENQRRQRIFQEYGVNNINLYTQLYKAKEARIAIPHLLIIIDEFAELKREEPEFMKELISVAQVGRSLGVHLILSTQKPNGTVDENIWSNTKFRLCLRVQDRQDSNGMLHKPDAAYITQAGRGYLQVGNDEVYELFQSGYSGASYEETGAGKGAVAMMLTETGKQAIVGNRTKTKQQEARKRQWLRQIIEEVRAYMNQIGCTIEDIQNGAVSFEDLFAALRRALKLEDSDSDRQQIRTLIECWPVQKDSGHDLAELIDHRAAQLHKKLPEKKVLTQLEAVIQYLAKVAVEQGYTQKMQLWMPVLPERLLLRSLVAFDAVCFQNGSWKRHSRESWTLEAVVGLSDDPVNQAQNPLSVHLSEGGHHAICGSVSCGKSTFLQTMIYSFIYKYSPEELNIYIMDFSSQMLGAFEDAPHVGAVMYDSDIEMVRKFFVMLDKMMDERKRLFRGGNYSQYVRVNGLKMPAIMVVIDNMASFREKMGNELDASLLRLSREGTGYGIFLVASSAGFGSSEIPGRIGDNIRTVIALDMGDKFKFADVLRVSRTEVLPEAGVKGRGLAFADGALLEYQTALAVDSEDDYSRIEKIRGECRQMKAAWKGKTARRIPVIPERPVLSDLTALEEYQEMIASPYFLPVAYRKSDASVYAVQLSDTYSYIIQGKSKSGKTNFMKALIYAAYLKKGQICIMESKGDSLKKLAQTLEIPYKATVSETFEYITELSVELVKRNKVKRQCREQEMEPQEIFEEMRKFPPIFIFLSDVTEFVELAYQTYDNGTKSMGRYLENFTEKGALHNIYLFGCLNPGNSAAVAHKKVYMNLIADKCGVHLGGNVNSQQLFAFSNTQRREFNKEAKPGSGLAAKAEEHSIAEEIIIPLVKGITT